MVIAFLKNVIYESSRMVIRAAKRSGGKRKAAVKTHKVSKKAAPRKVEKKLQAKHAFARKPVRVRRLPAAPKPKVAIKKRPKVAEAWSLEELISKVSQEVRPQEERRIEESKFDIGVPRNGGAKPSYEIPFEYNVDRAVVLTVDPRFVFTYWEVRHQSMHDATARLGPSAKLTLRFYDISATGDPDSSPSWDVEVFDRMGNWYLRLDFPEQLLCLDVGMKNEFGAFHRIARSNLIKLPRQALASPGPLKWMVVSPDGQKVITDVEEYTDADLELLRKILGPYFFDLLMRGQFASIAGSSLEAIFQEVAIFRMPIEISSSPSSWSGAR